MDTHEIHCKFKTEKDCHNYLVQLRWPNGVECVYCASTDVCKRSSGNRFKCRRCNKSFSVTVNTIFHATKLPMTKWFLAISQILAAKKGISSLQLSRAVKVNKNTAWYMQARIRSAMGTDPLLKAIGDSDRKIMRRNFSMRRHLKQRSRVCVSYNIGRTDGYFPMLKRAIIGQYHKLSSRHVLSYIDEIAFKKKHGQVQAFDLLLAKACAIT